jgi:hypothetical protein
MVYIVYNNEYEHVETQRQCLAAEHIDWFMHEFLVVDL